MKNRYVFLGVFMVCALVILTQSSCSSTRAPASTGTLLMRYTSNEDASNFAAHANIDVSVSALGIRAKIPVVADFETSGNAAHGTVTADLSALDTRNYTMEVYAELQDDAIVCYLSSPNDKAATWRRWTIDTTSSIDLHTIAELLKASEFTKIAKDSDKSVCYELTVPTTAVIQTASRLSTEPVAFGGMDEAALLEAVEGDRFSFDFTSDCLLRSVQTSALVDLKGPDTNNVQVTAGLDGSVVFDSYGTVSPKAMATPRTVATVATNTNAPIDLAQVLGAQSPLAGVIHT